MTTQTRGVKHKYKKELRHREWFHRLTTRPGYSTQPSADIFETPPTADATQPQSPTTQKTILIYPFLPVETSPRFFMRTELGLLNTQEKVKEERKRTQMALEALRKQKAAASPDPTKDKPTYFNCWEDNLKYSNSLNLF